ncbi:spore germination protein GerW family protein [Halomarina halobia]|uniref:Spore germination protein GerW family protein n=1 Tax=Halomarina halobia TaxID=3033386 RepID=A0ABD6A9P1_9EURY|nr:spore germination protein GerW family protein [Halomarina sp. PSR21]
MGETESAGSDGAASDSVTGLRERLGGFVEQLSDATNARTVYADPVEVGDRTVIPVARVAFGFGGGYGPGRARGDSEGEREDEEGGGDGTAGDAAGAPGEGWGGGGGVSATPLGVVEVTDDGVRFVRFADRRRLAGAFLLGVLAGAALRRRRS